MTTTITRRDDTAARAERDSFGQLLHAEWTKFRTVRGWVIGMIAGGLLIIAVNLIPGGQCGGMQANGQPGPGGPGCVLTLGPTGHAVTDSFYFVHEPMGPAGSITVRATSMTGSYSPGSAAGPAAKSALQPWSKAGIIIKAGTRPGSAYAAMMVTGTHGVRMQWDYTQDAAGLSGAVSATAPRWLRLTRSDDTITGYDSADGTHWTRVGTVTLPGLPAAAQAGLFAASPASSSATSQSASGSSASGLSTQATAAFDHVAVRGVPGSRWSGTSIGAVPAPDNQPPRGGYRQVGGRLTVTGSGDIAPALPGGDGGTAGSVADTLAGTFAGLIVVLIVGTMFITTEFRRGLIRVTLTASPRRGRVLAAKAAVLGAVTFLVGLPAAYIALVTGERKQHDGGISTYPVPALTEVRLIVGTAALLAVAAVLALGIGAALRRGAAAVSAVIAVIVLPYFFAGPLSVLPAGAAQWLLRFTPAAGFAIQQAYPGYPQLDASYTPANGYFPLASWAGFAVLCVWAALALAVAGYLLRRRDA
jgi:ABC-type transport system involved in multi-copper enzyme maturation permease subunit